MVAGYRIGRAAPDLRIGADKVAAIYLGSQRLYPSSLTWSTDLLQRGTFTTTRYPANFKVGLAALVFDTLYFTATRRDAVLRVKRLVTATQQTYAMTFPAVPLRRALRMSCNHTLIQLYGQDAIVALGNIMGAEQGLFALTGRAVDMAPDRYLEMVSRTFSLTGPATNVRATRRLTMAQASFNLTGQNMAASKGVLFPTNGTTYSLTGQAITPKAGRRLNAAPQTSFTLAGQAMTPKVARKLVMAMGARTLTGQAMTPKAARKIVLDPIYGGYNGFSIYGQNTDLIYVANPAVANVATGSANNVTNYAVPLPASIVAGQLLVMFVTIQGGGARTISTPAGWVEAYNVVNSTVRRAACYFRAADGFEGSTVNVSVSAGSNYATVAYSLNSVSGWDIGTPVNGTSNPNPPSVSSTSGNGRLWIASVHVAGGAGSAPSAPTNYSTSDYGNQSTSVGTGAAYRSLTAASEDPGAFTMASSVSVAQTLCFR